MPESCEDGKATGIFFHCVISFLQVTRILLLDISTKWHLKYQDTQSHEPQGWISLLHSLLQPCISFLTSQSKLSCCSLTSLLSNILEIVSKIILYALA